jgi:hypothetical protein
MTRDDVAGFDDSASNFECHNPACRASRHHPKEQDSFLTLCGLEAEATDFPLFWKQSSGIAGDAISFDSPLAPASGRDGMINSRPRIAIGV